MSQPQEELLEAPSFGTRSSKICQKIPFGLPWRNNIQKIFKNINAIDPTKKSIGTDILKYSFIPQNPERPGDEYWK